jgi:glycosyltransferase involved in cell wall biosynthesis
MAKSTTYLYQTLTQFFDVPWPIKAIAQKPLQLNSLPSTIDTISLPLPIGRETWRTLTMPTYTYVHRPRWIHFPANGLIPAHIWAGTQVATTLHDVLQLDIPNFYPENQQHKKKAYYKRLEQDISRSDLIFTVSEYSKQRIEHHFGHVLKHNPVVIPNACTLHSSEVKPTTFATENFFLYTGRYEKRKGLEWLLEAYLMARKSEHIQSALWLTGKHEPISPGFEANLTYGKSKGWIKELGYVSDEKMQQYTHPKQRGLGSLPLRRCNMAAPWLLLALQRYHSLVVKPRIMSKVISHSH